MNEKELEELEIYLEDEDNNTIYEELTKTDYAGLFEPLEFFRLFYSQMDFIKKSKDKPLFVIEKLNDLKLSIKQKIIFFGYLLSFWDDQTDRRLRICRRQIEKLVAEVNEENEKAELLKQNAEFEGVLKHLETLPNTREMISYLKQAKTDYEKNKTSWQNFSGLTFDKKCELEIKRLEELRKEEISNYISQTKNAAPKKSLNDRKKDKDSTLDQAVLAFSYLFDYAKVDARNTEKAEFISFLTGFSKNTIVQRLSRLHEKADLNFIGYEKDMKKVRGYFEKLNLSEVIKAIDNDLET